MDAKSSLGEAKRLAGCDAGCQHCPRVRVPPRAAASFAGGHGAGCCGGGVSEAEEEAGSSLLAAEWGVTVGRLLCHTAAALGQLGGGGGGGGAGAATRATRAEEAAAAAATTEETCAAALMCAAALRTLVADDDALATLHTTPCSLLAGPTCEWGAGAEKAAVASVPLLEVCVALLARPPQALLCSPQGVMVESAAVYIIHRVVGGTLRHQGDGGGRLHCDWASLWRAVSAAAARLATSAATHRPRVLQVLTRHTHTRLGLNANQSHECRTYGAGWEMKLTPPFRPASIVARISRA